jgi:hypothetical protein
VNLIALQTCRQFHALERTRIAAETAISATGAHRYFKLLDLKPHKILGIRLQGRRVGAANGGSARQSCVCLYIPSWRAFWITMFNWSMPDMPPELALARAQIEMPNPTS